MYFYFFCYSQKCLNTQPTSNGYLNVIKDNCIPYLAILHIHKETCFSRVFDYVEFYFLNSVQKIFKENIFQLRQIKIGTNILVDMVQLLDCI